MATAKEIAQIFAYLSLRQEGAPIERTRLNKLLYFAQGHALAQLGRTLFTNQIDAWDHGPVVAVVYSKYDKIIEAARRDGISKLKIEPQDMELILDVWDQYKGFKARELVDMTHQDGSPWSETYVEGQRNLHIPTELIERFFTMPQNRLHHATISLNKLPIVDALPAADYDPEEDSVWEALLNDAK